MPTLSGIELYQLAANFAEWKTYLFEEASWLGWWVGVSIFRKVGPVKYELFSELLLGRSEAKIRERIDIEEIGQLGRVAGEVVANCVVIPKLLQKLQN